MYFISSHFLAASCYSFRSSCVLCACLHVCISVPACICDVCVRARFSAHAAKFRLKLAVHMCVSNMVIVSCRYLEEAIKIPFYGSTFFPCEIENGRAGG